MINFVPRANVYPTEQGFTLGEQASGELPGTPAGTEAGGGGEVEAALSVGGQASPIVGLVVFVVLAFLISMLATRYKRPDESYANIRGSAYNVLFISLVAVAGIPIWKFLLTKIKLPGVSTWVHSV